MYVCVCLRDDVSGVRVCSCICMGVIISDDFGEQTRPDAIIEFI